MINRSKLLKAMIIGTKLLIKEDILVIINKKEKLLRIDNQFFNFIIRKW